MIAIGQRTRFVVVVAAIVCFVGAFAGPPLQSRGAVDRVPANVDTAIIEPNVASPITVVAQRDPFSGHDDESELVAKPISPVPVGNVGPLPSNLGNAPIPLVPAFRTGPSGTETSVQAIIMGPHPFALIAHGASTQIAGIGDLVDGQVIRAITLTGIALAGGRTLALASPAPPSATTALPWPGGSTR